MINDKDHSHTNHISSNFLQENINLFSEELFRENVRGVSGCNTELGWLSTIIKPYNITKRSNEPTENELSYWKYPARKMGRAVSEPCIQTKFIPGTISSLQKSNSFHELCNFKQQFKPSVDPFKPKPITWLYVTKAQCYSINSTKTDKDLIRVFHDIFQWETPNERSIMSRLFADVAKYCTNSEFTDAKMSTLLGIYFYTHLFNKSLNALNFEVVYDFFKELIIHHSLLIPPDHVNIFSTEEATSLMNYFLNKYLICLPLIRHICVSRSIMKVQWKRNESNQNDQSQHY